MKVNDLYGSGAAYNPRDIQPSDLVDLNELLREYGSLDGVLKNVRTGNIFGGNQRVKVFGDDWLIEREDYADDVGTVGQGYVVAPNGSRFPYREVDWDLDREMAANLVANTHKGSWNLDKKTEMLEHLVRAKMDLKLAGQSQEEAQHLLGKSDNSEAEKAAQEFKDSIKQEKPKHPKALQELLDQGHDDPDGLAMQQTIDINITLPAGIVLKIDRESASQGMNPERSRSKIILMALNDYFSI